MSELIERLRKRAAEDRACAANSAVVAALLQPEMDKFNAREAPWNTYAVRMAVDHTKSVERDNRYADDLETAAGELVRLQALVEELAGAPNGASAVMAPG